MRLPATARQSKDCRESWDYDNIQDALFDTIQTVYAKLTFLEFNVQSSMVSSRETQY